MKGTLIILAVSAIAGAGLTLSGIGHQITLLLSPLTTTASGLFQQAQTLYTGIASNPLFTPVLTLTTAVGIPLIIMYARNAMAKAEVQKQAEMAKLTSDAYATVGNVQSQAQARITTLEQQNVALTEKLSGVPDPSALVAKVESQKTEIQQLIAEKAEAMRILTAIRTPNINDQINLLEQAGYQVRKLIP